MRPSNIFMTPPDATSQGTLAQSNLSLAMTDTLADCKKLQRLRDIFLLKPLAFYLEAYKKKKNDKKGSSQPCKLCKRDRTASTLARQLREIFLIAGSGFISGSFRLQNLYEGNTGAHGRAGCQIKNKWPGDGKDTVQNATLTSTF